MRGVSPLGLRPTAQRRRSEGEVAASARADRALRCFSASLALAALLGFTPVASCAEPEAPRAQTPAAATPSPWPELTLPALLARDERGLGIVRALGAESELALVPLTSRSERVQRARVDRARIELALLAESEPRSVRVRCVEHALGEQLLLVDGELRVLGEPRLPTSARAAPGSPRAGENALPWLARLDACSWSGPLVLEPPSPFDAELALHALHAADGRATRLAAQEAAPLELDRPIDQLVYARSRALVLDEAHELALLHERARRVRITSARPRPGLALEPAQLELEGAGESREALLLREFECSAPSAPPAGRTLTLVVELGPRAKTSVPPARVTPPAPVGPTWRDVARERGIDFVHAEGPDLQLDIRPTMGPGLALGDADGDGSVDLYLPQGAGREGSEAPLDRLYLNDGRGQFADATAASGIADPWAGMGALFFDAEGDVDLDLFVANYGPCRLWANDGTARFADATAALGAELGTSALWNTAVCAGDADLDGDLDLYLTRYLDYDPSKMPPAGELPYQRDDPLEMLPYAFPGQRNAFLRNESGAGELRFVDVTDELGLADADGRGMQAVFWDFDGDGDQDLYVANDVSPNRLFANEGGRYTEIAYRAGLDDPRGSMGLAPGDYDADGDEDVFVTNWQLEANALYRNQIGEGGSGHMRRVSFRDAIVESGLGPWGVGLTGWGAVWADFDLDGDADLAYANGYTSPDYASTGICLGQPCHAFWNGGRGTFTRADDARGRSGCALERELPSRALAACDFDGDGRLELALSANNGPFRLLEQVPGARTGSDAWIVVRLRGRGINTHAIGARVELRTQHGAQQRVLRAGSSYLAGNAPELHFGLGAAQRADELRVRWPSGRESVHRELANGRVHLLEEPD